MKRDPGSKLIYSRQKNVDTHEVSTFLIGNFKAERESPLWLALIGDPCIQFITFGIRKVERQIISVRITKIYERAQAIQASLQRCLSKKRA